MRQESGFTMVEMMVTVAIAVIVLTLAVPAFRDFMQSTTVVNTTNEFALSINVARSEAVKRGIPVYLSAVPSGNAANAWGAGWRVWLDDDADEVYDAGEQELHLAEPLKPGLTLNSVDNVTKYKYLPTGRVDKYLPSSSNWEPAGDTLHLCDQRDGTTDRELVINAIGRLVVKTKALCP